MSRNCAISDLKGYLHEFELVGEHGREVSKSIKGSVDVCAGLINFIVIDHGKIIATYSTLEEAIDCYNEI